jgi:hypothetical protein
MKVSSRSQGPYLFKDVQEASMILSIPGLRKNIN